jgi:hypothetical protein
MGKHTPEKWTADEDWDGNGMIFVRDETGRTVARLHAHLRGDVPPLVAKARLMAAAPELAEALRGYVKGCVSCLGTGTHSPEFRHRSEAEPFPCPSCMKARAAIASAGATEGE